MNCSLVSCSCVGHSDGSHEPGSDKSVCRFVKCAFYLDPLTRDTGALRVIPGSHHHGDAYASALQDGGVLGSDGAAIPCTALESQPGDLLCFNHLLKHASFGGGVNRR